MGAFGNLLQQYWGNSNNNLAKYTASKKPSLEEGQTVKIGNFDVLIEEIVENGFYGVIINQRKPSDWFKENYVNTRHFFEGFNYKLA